jgi:two-component system phosphate regulon sensor histidine kinase PhoR
MKHKKKLIWQLYPWFLMVTLMALFAVTWYTSNSLRSFLHKQIRTDLQNQGLLLKKQITRGLMQGDLAGIERFCKESGSDTIVRLTVILPDGRVVGDSKKNPRKMDNHRDRPEIISAYHGDTGNAIRYSNTLKQNMMYVAIPLKGSDRIIGVLRTSIPITAIDTQLRSFQIKITAGGLIVAVLAAVISLLVSRRITRPIEEMKQGAERFAKGELSHRLHPPATKELARLAEGMNEMAAHLDDRIKTVINQRNEYEAVLSSMMEGVIALDRDEKIISINQAALNILSIKEFQSKGRTIQELVRNPGFHRFLHASLDDEKMENEDFEINRENRLIINTRCAPLRDSRDNRIGTLIVLNDVTKIRQLENVRKEFVANASHEIKTPLTAIKGFVEVLQHNVGQDFEQSEKFLGIVMKHVDRLNAVIEDLLSLARLEKIGEKDEVQLECIALVNVIRNATQVVQYKADEKEIQLSVTCDPELIVNVDASIFEQALINLLDNAVTYSPEESRVSVEVTSKAPNLLISIIDQGPGIPKEHLPRLFERFYRVDKARSRKHGGTGLGLAIVKHIVQAHKGKISVDSTQGEGTMFRIALPADVIVQNGEGPAIQ